MTSSSAIEGGKPFTPLSLFWCGVVGLVITGLIIVITEYYTGTGKRPVNSIAEASITGHGTNVIQGLAVSLESTALPALVIIAGIIVTYNLAGLFGIAVAVATMLALAGMIVALDAFGPVTDNAGGIAEMAGLPDEVRSQHRRARCGGQHHQGRHQGLCHRFGGPRRPGAVRRLYPGPQTTSRPMPRAGSFFDGVGESTSPWPILTSSSACCSAACCRSSSAACR